LRRLDFAKTFQLFRPRLEQPDFEAFIALGQIDQLLAVFA
jgi:hypothetical protein